MRFDSDVIMWPAVTTIWIHFHYDWQSYTTADWIYLNTADLRCATLMSPHDWSHVEKDDMSVSCEWYICPLRHTPLTARWDSFEEHSKMFDLMDCYPLLPDVFMNSHGCCCLKHEYWTFSLFTCAEDSRLRGEVRLGRNLFIKAVRTWLLYIPCLLQKYSLPSFFFQNDSSLQIYMI